jgi:hypothetical protein
MPIDRGQCSCPWLSGQINKSVGATICDTKTLWAPLASVLMYLPVFFSLQKRTTLAFSYKLYGTTSLSIKKATRCLTVKDMNIDGGHWCCPWLTVVGSRVLHISVTDHNPGADGVIQPGRQVAQGGLLTVRTVHVL